MRFGPSRTVADRWRGALIGTTLLHPGARRAHQPNGNLLVMPDVVDFVLATAGTAQVQIAFPGITGAGRPDALPSDDPVRDRPLLGFVAITATDALQLTIGWL